MIVLFAFRVFSEEFCFDGYVCQSEAALVTSCPDLLLGESVKYANTSRFPGLSG